MTSDRGILSAAANTAATSMAGVAIAFALSIVVARTLGPMGKGTYDLMVASASLVALTLGLSLSSGVVFVVARGVADARSIPIPALASAVLLGLLAAVILALINPAAVLVGILPPNGGPGVVGGIVILAGATFYASISRAVLVGTRRIVSANNLELAGRAVGLSVAIFLGHEGTALTFTLALLVGIGFGAILQTLLIRPKLGLGRPAAKEIVQFSVPSYLSNILQFLNYRLDLFFVALFRDPAEVGLYALAGTLAQLIWLLPRAMATVLFPAFAAGSDDALAVRQTAKAARFTTLISVLSAAGLGIVALWFIPTVYGVDYAPSVGALWLLLPGAAALSPAAVVAAYFLGLGRPGLNARVSGVALVVTVLGDLLLIPAFGMLGAAIASSLSYGSTLIMTLLIASRLSDTRVNTFLVTTPQEISGVLSLAVRMLTRR